MIVGEAGVLLRPESKNFPGQAEDELSGPMKGVAGKVAGFFAAAFAAVQIGGFLKDAIMEASDLSESASKVGVVFGDSAAQVLAFADTASTSLGQSRAQALEAAGTFGNLLRSLGLTEQASADMSTTFVGLASDLASFNNTDPAEALEALRAGLTGETEPLKRYGINLNEAAIQQEAVRLGLAATGEQLDASTKAQAAYSLIMQQSALAQGDFGRTSAGLANQQRIVAAQFVDLKANIGGLFVPAVANASGIVTGRFMPALLTATAGLPALGDALGRVGDLFRLGFSDGLDAVNEATVGVEGAGFQVLQVAGYVGNLAAIFQEAFADGQAGAELLSSGGLAGLAARAGVVGSAVRENLTSVFSDLQTRGGQALLAVQGQLPALQSSFASAFGSLREAVAPALESVRDAFSAALPAIQETFSGLFSGLTGGGGGGGLSAVVGVISSVLSTIVPLIAGYISRYAEVFAALIPIVSQLITGLAPIIVGLVQQVGPVLLSLLPVVSQVAGILTGVLVTALQALLPVIPVIVQVVSELATILAGAFLSVLQAIVPVIPTLVQVFASLATILAGAFLSVLQALLPILPSLVGALAQVATVLVGVLMSALQAILPVLPSLIQVFVQLITQAVVPLLPLLPILANLFVTILTALAPIIPPLLQIITLVIQLAVAALQPLMAIIPLAVNLFSTIVSVLAVVVQAVVGVIGIFISMASTVISVVVGFVSAVVSTFTSMYSSVTGVVNNIFTTVGNIFRSIATTVSNVVSGITSAVTGAFSSARDSVVGIFSGIGSAVSGAFSGVGNAIRGVVNNAIGLINSGISFINNNLIDTANIIPGVNIPHIPSVPRLHSGGIFDSGLPEGEGLALLRDRELVVTPEQQETADRLLRELFAGRTPVGAATTPGGESAGVTVNNTINASEGMDVGELSAHVSRDTVWALGTAATRQVPVTAS